MPKRVPIQKSEVLLALKERLPEGICEDDKSWLWVVYPPLAPEHNVKGGCTCDTCKSRAERREILKNIGFIFSFSPHKLSSGKESRWGHSCDSPTPFHRNKSKSKTTSSGGSKPIVPAMEQDDKELEAAMEFFNR